MKFYYKPIEAEVEKAWKANTQRDMYEEGEFNLANATLVVEADSPEESERIRKAITNILMWEETEAI